MGPDRLPESVEKRAFGAQQGLAPGEEFLERGEGMARIQVRAQSCDRVIEFAKITNQRVGLGGKEVKERALGDARPGDDLIDADRIEARFLEKEKGGIANSLSQVFAGDSSVRVPGCNSRDHGHDRSHEGRCCQVFSRARKNLATSSFVTTVMTMVTRVAARHANRAIPREDLRQRISDAALFLFKESGFDAVSVDQIVTRARVSKGAFFNFFPTKADALIGYFRELDDAVARLSADLEIGREKV